MHPDHLTAAALAFWSYDEENCVDKINRAFRGRLRPHFVKSPDGSHFYGMVSDPDTGTAWIVSRGTDGDTPAGNARSWLYNANVFTGRDGMHNGFQERANIVFDRFKSDLPRFYRVVFVGHSQGAAVSQILAKLACENLSSDKTIDFIVFAAPPPGNRVFAATLMPYFINRQLTGVRWIMPGDPIATPLLRNEKSWLFNGVDNGEERMLPDLIQYKIGPAEVAMHSCRIYTTAMMLQMALDGGHTDTQYEFMGQVFRWCAN